MILGRETWGLWAGIHGPEGMNAAKMYQICCCDIGQQEPHSQHTDLETNLVAKSANRGQILEWRNVDFHSG